MITYTFKDDNSSLWNLVFLCTVSDQLLGDGEEKKKRITLNIDTKMLKIGFIGGGKMAQALARGFIRSGKN